MKIEYVNDIDGFAVLWHPIYELPFSLWTTFCLFPTPIRNAKEASLFCEFHHVTLN